MPGIYLHIPFCKQACHYCNFHFSTSLKLKGRLLSSMLKELELRKNFFSSEPELNESPGSQKIEGRADRPAITSIYFGGGTPSLLSPAELERIFEAIYRDFSVAPDAEITLEANPDDLTETCIAELRRTPVNRLSIGIQSFAEADLQWMNRAHNAAEAQRCIESALAAGFDNLTCDLIYGAPTTSDVQWAANVQKLIDYGIPHLSCYCLTVEPKTALAHFIKTGKSPAVDDEKAARQFHHLMDTMEAAGYEHYEISNFAKAGCYARHNTSYWKGEPYLGIGPGAHSFRFNIRQWNLPNNALYVKCLEPAVSWSDLKGVVFEEERLSPRDRYNEYVMTGLRTMWGCRPEEMDKISDGFGAYFAKAAAPFISQGLVEEREGVYTLTHEGKLLGDFISAELFFN